MSSERTVGQLHMWKGWNMTGRSLRGQYGPEVKTLFQVGLSMLRSATVPSRIRKIHVFIAGGYVTSKETLTLLHTGLWGDVK